VWQAEAASVVLNSKRNIELLFIKSICVEVVPELDSERKIQESRF
jgi:hypothetical protein